MDIAQLLNDVNNFVWGPVMLALLVGTGVFLTVRLRFLPWLNLWYAIRLIFHKKDRHAGDISPFQSLMTALSATIGTGNIVGVATAMVLGGPGAIVWMWISAAFGLATKYGESVLAVKYRETNSVGEMAGGPMYAMKHGIGGTVGRGMLFHSDVGIGRRNCVQLARRLSARHSRHRQGVERRRARDVDFLLRDVPHCHHRQLSRAPGGNRGNAAPRLLH